MNVQKLSNRVATLNGPAIRHEIVGEHSQQAAVARAAAADDAETPAAAQLRAATLQRPVRLAAQAALYTGCHGDAIEPDHRVHQAAIFV